MPTKEELNRYKADSKRSLRGFRMRKHIARQSKLIKSKSRKAKAISVLLAAGVTTLHATAMV
jgi:hypothetical protein